MLLKQRFGNNIVVIVAVVSLIFGFLLPTQDIHAQGPLDTQPGCEANDGVWVGGECTFPATVDPGTGGASGGSSSSDPERPNSVSEACSDGSTAFCSAPKPQTCEDGASCWRDLPIFKDYIVPAIDILTIAILPVVTLVVVLGGVQYTMATGDPSKVSAAKQRIINGVIALVCYVFLWSFLQWLVPGGFF